LGTLGERESAESVAAATDPLNLIRLIPAKGTQDTALSDPLSLARAWGFL
jgi:hypothetical protein